VAALEVGLRSISTEVDSLRVSVDRVQSTVSAGLTEIRRDLSSSGRTNWGWIFAAVAVLVAIVGAVGSAWVRPLQAFDEAISARLDRVQQMTEDDVDRSIRNEERLRVYAAFGRFPGNEKPPVP
jgi:hypothetical protein